jgi:tetratricopeptide (TPR) repeat protein
MSFKQYGEALGYFEKALEKGMANSDYHYLMSICQFNTGKREEAIATLLEGEKLGVSTPAYFSLEFRLFMKFNRVEYAKLAIQRGLELFPTDQELNTYLFQLQPEGPTTPH